jgi:hypothetical protein
MSRERREHRKQCLRAGHPDMIEIGRDTEEDKDECLDGELYMKRQE